MPHAVLLYKPKQQLIKRHQLRLRIFIRLKKQNKIKFIKLNLILFGIADDHWFSTDGMKNANLQHGA